MSTQVPDSRLLAFFRYSLPIYDIDISQKYLRMTCSSSIRKKIKFINKSYTVDPYNTKNQKANSTYQ